MRLKIQDFKQFSRTRQESLRQRLSCINAMIDLDYVSIIRLQEKEIYQYGRVKLSLSRLKVDIDRLEKEICSLTPKILFIRAGVGMTHEDYCLLEEAFSALDISYQYHCGIKDEIDIRWITW